MLETSSIMGEDGAASDLVVFGYVATDATEAHRLRMTAFAAELSKLAKVELAVCRAKNYTEIAELVLRRQVDFAWLPTVPYIALSRRQAVDALVSLVRDGHTEFYSVLIVRSDSAIKSPLDLVGQRAAWVEPHSASGYVLPRIGLAAVGVDPRTAFREERFYRSHEKLVRAVLDRRADFGATYGGLDDSSTLSRGAWAVAEVQGKISVLATFVAIPPDVIAARSDLPAYVSESITHALTHAASEPALETLAKELFGATSFRRGTPEGYLEFCRATMRASEEGLLEGEEKQ
jgi:phosphonate transport system substrate-binding protein